MATSTTPLGAFNYRLIWNPVTRDVEAKWGGGPNDPYADFTISAAVFGARGVFAIRGQTWTAEPLDAYLDPATPTTVQNRSDIRDAVLAGLEADAPFDHIAVINARKNGQKDRAAQRLIEKVKKDAELVAMQAEIDDLDAGI